MRPKTAVILSLILALTAYVSAAPPPAGVIETDIVTISVEQQHDVVQPGGKSALAVHFELKKDWHFYASAKTAPGGVNLKVKASDKDFISFSEPIFPQPHLYFDSSSGQKLEVFSDKFTVFLPFSINVVFKNNDPVDIGVKINIEGAVCSDIQCRMPNFGDLTTVVRISPTAAMGEPKFALPEPTKFAIAGKPVPQSQWAGFPTWFALCLAFLAGLSLNIMPCVWPVLPLIVMRLVEQAKQNKRKSIEMGLAFCLGILLFFAALAAANIILQIVYGTVLQWADQFRSPAFVAATALLLVVLALFMFGVFNITVPSAIAGKSGSAKSLAGSIGIGFLAAILSTPCSFGILAASFAWAQTQPLPLATVAIMTIGIGMALPYAILTSMPTLLKRLPKTGRWMELFKQAIGFVLLFIAVWLIAALPQIWRMDVLYFAVVLGFCVWMWGCWVDYNTKRFQKWTVRILSVMLAILAGFMLLTEPIPSAKPINWQPYDASLIETAIANGRPVLLKFTADWCISCKWVERKVYNKEEISRLIWEKDVLAIKADTTTKDLPATLALKNVYHEPGVPVSILFIPGSKEPVRWRGKSFAGELKKLLKTLPDKN